MEMGKASADERCPKLLALSDVVRRWVYTKQGVLKLIRGDESFPGVVMTVCDGKVRLWLEADILAYERDKPWLLDDGLKRRRQLVGFVLTGQE